MRTRQANRTFARGSLIEHDLASDDWHRTTQEGHVRRLLQQSLESTSDQVYVMCEICFGAVVVGPPLSARPSPTAARQAADLGCSISTYVEFAVRGTDCALTCHRSTVHVHLVGRPGWTNFGTSRSTVQSRRHDECFAVLTSSVI
jgi:hypothetical protein